MVYPFTPVYKLSNIDLAILKSIKLLYHVSCYNHYMQIIPAPLEKNASSLVAQIERLSPYFQTFQVDIADGIFVPNKTVQIEDLYKVLSIKYKEFKNLNFDFHLMVNDFEKDLAKLSKSF